MAIKKKRKGLTFVTEHYLTEETKDILTEIIVELFNHYERIGKSLFIPDELKVWIDVQGLRYSTHGWKNIASLIPFHVIGVDMDTRLKLFRDFSKIYEDYGQLCDDPAAFHVKLNENTVYKIKDMFSL